MEFGVGVAALGAAYWVYVLTHSSTEASPGAEAALHFGGTPTIGGGFVSASGAF